MLIKSVSVSNILSIEEASITLDSKGLILIEGWNHDADRANGAGKSAIFSAMVWGIYGNYPRNIPISDFVRRGSKKASVTVTLETSGHTLTITRSRPGGISIADEAGKTYTEDEYLSLLDVSYDQYLLIGYFAQSLSQRFLDLNDSGRKDLIVKLMKADAFQAAKEKVEADIKVNTLSLQKLSADKSNLSSKVEAWKESLVDEEELVVNIENAFAYIGRADKEIKVLASVQEPDTSSYALAIEKLQKQLSSIASAKGESKALRRQLQQLENEKPPEDVCDGICPCCGESLDFIDGSLHKHDSSSFASKLKTFKTRQSTTRASILASISQVEEDIGDEEKVRDTINRLQEKASTIRQEWMDAKNRRRELEMFIKSKRTELASLQKVLSEQEVLKGKIEKAEASISTLNEEMEALKAKAITLKTISDLFSPTGVQAYILDSVVDLFNQKVQEHVSRLWPQSSYELLTYRESKAGAVSAKMSDHLSIDGVDVPVGSLSGGERRCLSIAIDMALVDVVETYSGAKMGLVVMDEPFDGMDNVTRINAIELLSDVAKDRVVVVIDHSTEAQSMFDRVVKVEKRGGTSKVLW